MISENPKVSTDTDRYFRKFRNCILIREPAGGILFRDHLSEFFILEPDQAQIEVLTL